MQPFCSLDSDGALTLSRDLRPAFSQKRRQVADLRFPCRIMQHRLALCQHGRQQHILRCPYRGKRQVDHCAVQPIRYSAVQLTPAYGKACTHLTQRLQVHVNGTGAKLASAGVRHMTGSGTPQHRPQKNNGGAHLLHQRLRNGVAAQRPHLHRHGVFLNGTPPAQMGENPARCKDICQARTIFQCRFAVAQQCSGEDGQGAVFGTM